MPLDVVPDDMATPYVCPWCGDRFARRYIASDGVLSLEEHWRRNTACGANRSSVSSMVPSSKTFGEPWIQPGEGTLRRIRHVDEER